MLLFCFHVLQIDEVINQAQATRSVLGSQRALFGDVGGKVKVLSEKFPVIRGLLGIRHISYPHTFACLEVKTMSHSLLHKYRYIHHMEEKKMK